MPPFRAPFWLAQGHAQTIYAYYFAPRSRQTFRRERITTPDGDFIDLDWLDSDAGNVPLIILFHGLEGNSSGHYAQSLMAEVRQKNWRGVVVHFRGCSGEPNRLPRAYHSGDSAEIDWILRSMKARHPQTPLFAVGVSLGGNALLKWLGEQGPAAASIVRAAAAVSAPIDLPAAGHTLDRGFNRISYTRHFLKTLKRKARQKISQHRLSIDPIKLHRASTLFHFDDVFTAPLHGFRDAADYWQRASSKPVLHNISVPTLIINAQDDPFMPASALPCGQEVSASVTLDYPRHGGHVGFVSGAFPGNLRWLPQRLLHFAESHISKPVADSQAPAKQA